MEYEEFKKLVSDYVAASDICNNQDDTAYKKFLKNDIIDSDANRLILSKAIRNELLSSNDLVLINEANSKNIYNCGDIELLIKYAETTSCVSILKDIMNRIHYEEECYEKYLQIKAKEYSQLEESY